MHEEFITQDLPQIRERSPEFISSNPEGPKPSHIYIEHHERLFGNISRINRVFQQTWIRFIEGFGKC